MTSQHRNNSDLQLSDQRENMKEPLLRQGGGGAFSVSKEDLIRIASSCQERTYCEEVEYCNQKGGDQWIFQSLQTHPQKGIKGDDQDLLNRDAQYGNNLKPPVILAGFFQLLCDALGDFTLRILMVASVISMVIETIGAPDDHKATAWIEGFAILVAVFICSGVTAANDYSKERQFQALNNKADERKVVRCMRNGQEVSIHQTKVMVGDLIILQEGMEIPADGYCIEAADLTTDESAMTGETDPIKKNKLQECLNVKKQLDDENGAKGRHEVPSPLMMSGTKILTGSGKMIIIVVGDNSCVGKIGALLRSDDPDATPLQEKLEHLASQIGKGGLFSAIAIVIVCLIRFVVSRLKEKDEQFFTEASIAQLLSFFIIGITVVVVAIPEGLPLAVTLSLAYSVKKMLADQNLVRKLQACETMGGADCICSDKTGTLTQNKMTLTNLWNEKQIAFPYNSSKINLNEQSLSKQYQDMFTVASAVNSDAVLRPVESGSKTEVAILQFLEKCGINYEELRQKFKPEQSIPFNSKRKRMSVIFKYNQQDVLHTKGASEFIVSSCTHFHSSQDNSVCEITPELRKTMDDQILNMAQQSLRTIGIAYKILTGEEDRKAKDERGVYEIEKHDLTLLAIIGIKDVLRPEVPSAVEKCFRAGIKVRMVTGDNIVTAQAIAKECKIIVPGNKQSLVMEGGDFIQKIGGVVCKKCQTEICDCPRDSETAKAQGKEARVDVIKNFTVFQQIYPNLDVLARSLPEHKYALVTGLLQAGHVVAVTGDGTNDAPALKKADVGFAMGIAGTEVARESAAIILLDDNFNSIVKAVLWGRNIYDSIKKFLQFQLTVNVCAVVLTFISAAFITQKVIEPIQMLWINLIMDTLASLALATEAPNENLLLRKPHSRNDYMITKKMFKHILGHSFFQLIVLTILIFTGEQFIPETVDKFDTIKAEKYGTRKSGGQDIDIYVNPMPCKYQACYEDSKNPTSFKCVFNGKTFINTQLLDPNLFNQKGYYEQRTDGLIVPLSDDDINAQTNMVVSGREQSVAGDEHYMYYCKFYTPSRHFSVIFNTFVFLQIFNFINARKLFDEINVFKGITDNNLFGGILVLILILQVLLISFLGKGFKVYNYGFGLNIMQWLISVGIGAGSLIVSAILKLIKEDAWCNFQHGNQQMKIQNDPNSVLKLKRGESFNRRLSSSMHGDQLEKSRTRTMSKQGRNI